MEDEHENEYEYEFDHPVEEANERSIFGDGTAAEFYAKHGVTHEESYFTNERGMRIFTQSWHPAPADSNRGPAEQQARPALRGVICVVHGYTGESGWFVQLTSVSLARRGFAVYALDHAGHGFSDGEPRNFVPDVRPLLADCAAVFRAARARHPPDTPAFLYGESLGGALALLLHLDQERYVVGSSPWAGLVLNGAMCGVSAKFRPPWPLETALGALAWAAPRCPVPTRGNIPERSFRVEWKRRLALACPRRSTAAPRAATALELLRVCDELQSRFAEVRVPFFVVHGEEDVICDPEQARRLFREAGSVDKSIRVYEGMWHQLVGEPPENVRRVFGDIYEWLVQRAASPLPFPAP